MPDMYADQPLLWATVPNKVGLLGLWAETFLYGLYSTTFFKSVWIMRRRKRQNTTSAKIFSISSYVMYLVATLHIAVAFYRVLQCYVFLAGTQTGLEYYFITKGVWEHTTHLALHHIMLWFGEFLLTYRCYIVWGQNIWIVAPSIILCFTSVVVNVMISHHWHTKGLVVSPDIQPILIMSYPVAFSQNVLTTGLIVYRLVEQHRRSYGIGLASNRDRLGFLDIARIVIESAALYTLEFLLLIVLLGANSLAGQNVILSMVTPTTGIVFNLLALRLLSANSKRDQTTRPTTLRFNPGTETRDDNTQTNDLSVGRNDDFLPTTEEHDELELSKKVNL